MRFEPQNLYRWFYESNYIGEDYSDHYVVYSRYRDSTILNESNFEAIKKDFDAKNIKYTIVRFNHWLSGWYESIMIHDHDIESLRYADGLLNFALDYPILDEDDYMNRRYEALEEIYKDMGGKNGLYSYYGVKPIRSLMKAMSITTIRSMRKSDVMNIIDEMMDD